MWVVVFEALSTKKKTSSVCNHGSNKKNLVHNPQGANNKQPVLTMPCHGLCSVFVISRKVCVVQ